MTDPTPATGSMQVDTALVRELAELLDATALTEIEVQDGDRKIRVARTAAVVAAAPVSMPATPAPAAGSGVAAVESAAAAGFPEKSPMVGTVYLAADPTAKPFITVGESVTEGQTLVIIEAMKVMNPIAATRAGRVTRICVENGQPVEYDQSLVIIE